MALILKGQKDFIDTPVTVIKDIGRGKKEEISFFIRHKVLGLAERAKAAETAGKMNYGQFLREFCSDWPELKDAKGKAVAFNEENIASVLDDPDYSDVIITALGKGLFGPHAELAPKN